jgi:hypothetical protein|tara:strand:+ start:13099 stop:13347 length:249 start_codon:yes stop_codon:yes gene_type:complete
MIVVVTIVIMIVVVVIVLEWLPKLLPSECVGRLDRKNPQHSSTKQQFLFESTASLLCLPQCLRFQSAFLVFARIMLPVGEFH